MLKIAITTKMYLSKLSILIIYLYLCINKTIISMKLECNDDELEALINHKYIGKYKSYRSNAKLIRNLDKVIRFLTNAYNIQAVSAITSLSYEPLKGSPFSSVRVGYDTKYRLIFSEHEDKITLVLIELSEHYGDH